LMIWEISSTPPPSAISNPCNTAPSHQEHHANIKVTYLMMAWMDNICCMKRTEVCRVCTTWNGSSVSVTVQVASFCSNVKTSLSTSVSLPNCVPW
jgi:hypothetical protein